MKYQITSYSLIHQKIPKELSGYRIALFSDVHNCADEAVRAWTVRQLAKMRPDAVLVPGDLILKHRADREERPGLGEALQLVRAVAKDHPVYLSAGNHEARLRRTSEAEYRAFTKQLESYGARWLENERVFLADGALCLTALDLPLGYYNDRSLTLQTEELPQWIGSPSRAFNILMAHTPNFFPAYASWGAELTVSGHIHGGVIRLPFAGGLFSPYLTLFPKYDYGQFDLNDKTMIVTSGLGQHSLPVRFRNPLELVLITLRSPR